ncbi:unnamed protein product [Cuscuta campestris]|uniref:Serine carboxypeptidase-like 19 n=1 Tax=Cuscuta campestris TaxID=132261 RepID=A0A484K417_9ASTE|nr:unnamed protein product [Cuscuta campestris]
MFVVGGRRRCRGSLLLLLLAVLGLCSSRVCARRESFKVEYFPGFRHEGPLPFHLETGYIGVGEAEEVQLFYYFVRSESNHSIDPIVLWISGGPCCSTLFALTQEFGPLIFDRPKDLKAMPTLSLNPYPWTKIANFIMLDFPVGTGFSYSKNPAHANSTILEARYHGAEFVRKWLEDRPEYQSNPFYIGGDSYSGITIPVVAQAISSGMEHGLKPKVNFKGYLLGNPATFGQAERDYIPTHVHGLGLMSDEQYELWKRDCRENTSMSKCTKELEKMQKFTIQVMTANTLMPGCSWINENDDASSQQRALISNKRFKGVNVHAIDISIMCYGNIMAGRWANDVTVREALHIRKGSKETWSQCNHFLGLHYEIGISDARPYHANLSTKGYRSLIYSGDHDLLVPSISSEAWTKSLNYSILSDWRPWLVNGQIAGYTRTFSNNMTFATAKGSGHCTPTFTPLESFVMFKRWMSYEAL